MAVNVQPVPPNREYNETVRRFLDLLRRQVNTNTGGIQDIIDSLSAYTLVDGSRPFTAPVGGVTPVASTDLTTKAYVDGLVSGSGFWQRNGTVLSPVNVGDSLVVDSTIDLKQKLKFTGTPAQVSFNNDEILISRVANKWLTFETPGSTLSYWADGSWYQNVNTFEGYNWFNGNLNKSYGLVQDLGVVGAIAFRGTGNNYLGIPMKFSAYNYYTNQTTWEKGGIDWITSSNVFRIWTEAGSVGGTVRPIEIEGAGTTVIGTNTTDVVLTAKGVAGQTGNLQEWQDSIAANQAYISADGTLGQNAVDVFRTSTAGNDNLLIGATNNTTITGDENIFIGKNSGANVVAVSRTNGIGFGSLINNTGSDSNALGHASLQNNTGANSNGFGNSSLINNTGQQSNGFGYVSLQQNSGNFSNGFGTFSLQLNSGAFANGIGYASLQTNAGANSNGFGAYSLRNNTGANSNAFGHEAFLNNSTGTGNNTGIGHQVGYNNLSGSGLVLIGHQAGYDELGSNKLHIANNATQSLIYGEFDNKLLISNGQLEVVGQNDTTQLLVKGNATQTANLQEWQDSIGSNLAHISETGAFGQGGSDVIRTTADQTGGGSNTFLGEVANSANTGSLNVFVGRSAGLLNQSGGQNVFIGYQSGLSNLTGFRNMFLGATAGKLSTGSDNVMLGANSGNSLTSGNSNLFLGTDSGTTATVTSWNTYIGVSSGKNATGYSNVFIGFQSGQDQLGNNKLVIGNTSTSQLIYGEFDNEIVRINGDLQVKQKQTFDSYTNSSKGAGDLWFESNALWFQSANDERAVTLSNGTITADTSVSNTITETTVATLSISADEFHVGEMIKAKFFGRYDTANASDTFTARLKVGGVTVATLNSDPQNVTNAGLDLEFIFTVRSIGATGSIFGHAHGSFNTTLKQSVNDSATVIDTTTNNDITLTIEWDASDVSNSVTISQQYLEFIG